VNNKITHKSSIRWLVGIIAVALVLVVNGCSGQTNSKDDKKDTSAYTADNAYAWLKDSGLVTGEAKDITDQFQNTDGLVKAVRTSEADILEFEKADDAAGRENPGLNSYVVKNIYILIKKGQDNADNFIKVLESGNPVKDLETSYSSEDQKKVAKLVKNNADFKPLIDAYYALPKEEKSSTWDSYMNGKIVTWTGTIADLDAIGDSIVVYGSDDYNGEDWSTISSDKTDMMPYTFIVELKDESQKNGLKQGDKVTLKASLDSRGDKELKYNWKLYEGEVVE
jgi:hypothetical protein